jgi:hypothetical protein
MSASPFENFVNQELPKRISTEANPLTMTAEKVFVTTGVGLQVEARDLTELGTSAYQVALNNGYVGTVEEWLESLKGKSAYDVAVENGFTGTVEEWLLSLQADGISLPNDNKLYAKANNEWTDTGDVIDPVTGYIITDLGTY